MASDDCSGRLGRRMDRRPLPAWTSHTSNTAAFGRSTSSSIPRSDAPLRTVEEDSMADKLEDAALDRLFRTARTRNGWTDRPVTEEQLRELYDLSKFGPTSGN